MAPVVALSGAAGNLAPSEPAAALAEPAAPRLPPAPADGQLGFVVEEFVQPVIEGRDACPEGPALKLREAYLAGLASDERERLLRRENEPELDRRWKESAARADGANICSQPDLFDPPTMRTVRNRYAWGMDLDDGNPANSCGHEEFESPHGEQGIDNQEYRVLGCTLEWRNAAGGLSDQQIGTRQFFASGEWTQVILLRGVDSLEHDDRVEVIYANTADRPAVDSRGNYISGGSYSVNVEGARHRNVLAGRIVNGVLTTEPADIKLAQTWGQGGARDIRGNRSQFDFRSARLRLTFHGDGTMSGMLGGYRPIFDIVAPFSLGGIGSATVSGIDCSAYLKTLRQFADGLRNPQTGQCTGVSSAHRIRAVPAFVIDRPD